MKKSVCLLLFVIFCLTVLTGCIPGLPGSSEPDVPRAPEVLIRAGAVEAGMSVESIPVEVTLDNEPVACRVEWVCFEEDGYRYMESGETIPEGFYGRLDVYYFVPAGMEPWELPTTLDAPGGVFDGIGEGATDADGRMEGWAHIIYEFETPEQKVTIPDVVISVDELKPGSKFENVSVEVTLDGEPVDCTTEWIRYTEDDYYYVEGSELIPENFWGRLDVWYFLPFGVDPGDITVTLDAPGGVYDGTGEGATDADGCLEAWSHIVYEPELPEEAETDKPAEPTPQEHQHQWVRNDSLSRAAACEAEGVNHYICTSCDSSYEETVAATDHSWARNDTLSVAAGCGKDGYHHYQCSYCGASYQETIPAIDHSYQETQEYTAPTCTVAGSQGYACSNCGDPHTESLAATGHSWSEYASINGREHERSCTVCGETETEDHTIGSNGITCTGCGMDIIN